MAALFVATGGCYFGLPDVDPWDLQRDARLYAGPWPVVAHPPCAAWCRLAGLREHRYGYKKGEDGGCFASALASVRRWGGVLEHPAFSDAWSAHGLPAPLGRGGWNRDMFGGWAGPGGWSAQVNQRCYGHRARKATWLYAYGLDIRDVPALDWSAGPPGAAVVSGSHNHCDKPIGDRNRVWSREAKATPIPFRDVLLDIARSVNTRRAA